MHCLNQVKKDVEDAIINEMKSYKTFLQHRKDMNGTTNIQTHTAIPYTDEMRHGVWNRNQDNTVSVRVAYSWVLSVIRMSCFDFNIGIMASIKTSY
jgi:hypothetical protein